MDPSVVWGVASRSAYVWSAGSLGKHQVRVSFRDTASVADVHDSPTSTTILTSLIRLPSRLELDDSQSRCFRILLCQVLKREHVVSRWRTRSSSVVDRAFLDAIYELMRIDSVDREWQQDALSWIWECLFMPLIDWSVCQ
jgi:hypothetical protein